MAPDRMDNKAEYLRQSQNAQVGDATSVAHHSRTPDDSNTNRTNEQWKLLMATQNDQMMELIRMINEPQANVGADPQPALSITLPEFNPEEEGADALAWCNLIDICLGEYPLQGGSLIIALSNSLKGSASSWLPQVTYEGMTWAEFKVNFLACYDSQNTCAATMISINNSHPKEDESYAAYASRLVNSFLTRWKDLTSEQIAVSFVLAHISRFDNRVQRMAHTTEILTRGKLVQELAGFSHLKHKLQPNPDENIPVIPEKRVKSDVAIQQPQHRPHHRKRRHLKSKTATATLTNSEGLIPEICYKLQPNTDEKVLKVKLVRSTESIQRPPKKRKASRPKTATATSSKPMDVMPEPDICHYCSEQGHKAPDCPKKDAAISEPGPSSAVTASSHMATRVYGCVCCGPAVTETLRTPETINRTGLQAASTIYIEIDTEVKNDNVDQANKEDSREAKKTTHTVPRVQPSLTDLNNTVYIDYIDTDVGHQNLSPTNQHNKETKKYTEDINKNVIQANTENEATDVYAELVILEQCALVPNAEEIECGVCMDNYQPGQGVVLRECVHAFCKECLADVVKHTEEPAVSCPAMGCPGLLQQREIRALVSPEDYERWLAKGLAVAESGAGNSFHCRTADCKGWAMCDPGVTRFLCPVCSIINCVTCQAIHEDQTCEQYRAKKNSDEKTKTYLNNLLASGKAMLCPMCKTVITKQAGCDWIMCAACRMEICWATRGPRWGPRGHGDTSGGCRCKVGRKKCHPSCRDCH